MYPERPRINPTSRVTDRRQQKHNPQKKNKQKNNSEIDSVNVSRESLLLFKLKKIPETRQEKIKMLKEIINEEQLLTREKIKLSIKKMILSLC